MREAHLYRQVAELHASALDRGFLSTLGPKILTELYRAIDSAPSSQLILEAEGGKVLGFVTGGCSMGAIYRQMLRRPLHLAWAALPLVFQPRKVLGILEILRHGRGQSLPADLPEYELLSIALAPEARGSGIAAKLYKALIESCRKEGYSSFRITVGDGLGPAHAFYRKMGAEPVGRIEVHAGQGSTLYRQRL